MSEMPKKERGFLRTNFKPDSAAGRISRRLAAWLDSMTLKARVVLLVVVMFVIGVWGLALSITLALERDLTQLLSASVSTEAISRAEDLDRDIRLHVDAMTRLAAAITPEVLADQALLERTLDQFADTSAVVPSLCFVANRNGTVLAGYPEQTAPVGTSVADSSHFRQVMAGVEPVIGEPLLDAQAWSKSTFPVAVPVLDRRGAAAGALIGSIRLSDPHLFGQLERARVGRTGWFLVVTPKNRRIIAATDRSRIGTLLPGQGMISPRDRPIDDGYVGPGITHASIGPEVMTVAREMATTGWIVNAAVPTAEIFAPIASLKRQIYVAALAISLAMALILRHFLGRQFAPLAQAGGAMRRMTEGEIPMTAIAVTRRDEIGELIASFNQLVAERSRLEKSLQAEIIERSQANAALRESRDRLDGIYQSVGDGIVSIDAQQRIVLFNVAAERIFGYPAAVMIGQPLSVLLPERFRAKHDELVRNFDGRGQDGRGMGTYRLIRGLRMGGEEFPVEAAISQSGSPPNKLLTVILRDVTERRQVEQMREQLVRQLESLSGRLATAQEEERRRIAYELHEELGQEVSTLKLYLQMLAPPGGGTEAGAHHEQAITVTVHALERIRKLVLDLEPPELAAFGLYSAVRTYCQQQAEAGGWTLSIDAPKPDVRVPPPVELACFRILQEALNNVQQHAGASEVQVALRQAAAELVLTVRDDGNGFDRNAVGEDIRHDEGGGLGLFGMQIRARPVGGVVEIKSIPGAGTEVRAVFPLPVAAVEPDGSGPESGPALSN